MKRVAGYIRVSSMTQVDGSSIEVQEQQIRTYCQLKGFELVNIYCDPAVSGGKPISERPEGSKLMDSIRNSEVSGMVILKLDRGFRNTVDCLNTIDELDSLGVSLHIIDLGGSSVDSQSPSGRFMLTVLAAAAEMERQQIKARCNSGREQHKVEGKAIGHPPFGYSADSNGVLIPNRAEKAILNEIKYLKSRGFKLREIVDVLNSKGLLNRKGTHWSIGSVNKILRKRVA